eukprot:366348-Chlamydomonas_euryale.AAC.2
MGTAPPLCPVHPPPLRLHAVPLTCPPPPACCAIHLPYLFCSGPNDEGNLRGNLEQQGRGACNPVLLVLPRIVLVCGGKYAGSVKRVVLGRRMLQRGVGHVCNGLWDECCVQTGMSTAASCEEAATCRMEGKPNQPRTLHARLRRVLELYERLARNARMSTRARAGVLQLLRQVSRQQSAAPQGGVPSISMLSLGSSMPSMRAEAQAGAHASQQQQLYSVSLPPSSTASRIPSMSGSQGRS